MIGGTIILAGAGPARAHSPDGTIQLQPSAVVRPLVVTFELRLIYANDTHPVTGGATVTVTGTGPSGARVGPQNMPFEAGSDGYYRTTVTFPAAGSWAMTFSATTPAATFRHTESVPGPPASPTVPAPTAPAAPAPTAAAPTAPTAAAPSPTAPASPSTTVGPGSEGADPAAPSSAPSITPSSASSTTTESTEPPATTTAESEAPSANGATTALPPTTPAQPPGPDERAAVAVSSTAPAAGVRWWAVGTGAGLAALAVAGVVAFSLRKGAAVPDSE